MTSTWQPSSFDSSFESLPYPYPASTSPGTLGVPQQSPQPGGIRRARSSGALDFDAMGRRPSEQSSWSQISPFSPTTSLPPQRDEPYPSFEYYRRPSSTATYPLPVYPSPASSQTNLPENPRRFHRRTSSAQPAFFVTGGSTSSPPRPFTPMDSIASGSDTSSRRTSMSYSFSTPQSHRMQGQASVEDVNNFIKDMNEMLGPDTMKSFNSPPTTTRPTTTATQANGLTLTSTSSPPSRSPAPRQTYNVSGVLLNEEEYRQYTHSEQQNQSARPRHYSSNPLPNQYFAAPSAQYAPPQPSPGYDLNRPRSAPPSPQVDLSAGFVPYYSPPAPPSTAPAERSHFANVSPFVSTSTSSSNGYTHTRPFHRRGSSVDATIPRTMITTPSIPISYGYASYPTTPPRSNQPVGYPPPFIPTPQSQQFSSSYYDNLPVSRMFPSSSSSTTTTYHGDEAPISPVSPIRSAKGFGIIEGEGKYRYQPSTPESSPSKRGGGGTRGGKAKGPISFINFSASDSKVLLSGVAPSGSSKKRAREESSTMSRGTTAGVDGAAEGDAIVKKARK